MIIPTRLVGPQTVVPMQPLADVVAGEDGEVNNSELARALDVSRNAVIRWWKVGIRWDVADTLAVHLGYHPMEIWGNDWLEAVA